MKNNKILISIIFIVVLITIILGIFGIIKFKNNETFFKNTFVFELIDGNYEIEVPLYSYYSGAEGHTLFRFKSFKSKEKLESEIEEILNKYEKIVDENGNIYYKKDMVKIWDYSVIDDGLFSDIFIGIDLESN